MPLRAAFDDVDDAAAVDVAADEHLSQVKRGRLTVLLMLLLLLLLLLLRIAGNTLGVLHICRSIGFQGCFQQLHGVV